MMLPLLLTDLKKLEPCLMAKIRPAIHASLQMTSGMVSESSEPISLIGYLYVLEGSQNGGVFLKDLFAKSLKVESGDLSYFGAYGAGTRQHWSAFVERLNGVAFTEEESQLISRSAKAAFEGLRNILMKLFPYEDELLSIQASDINPEAGRHAIPDNPVEVALAIRAGIDASQRFPYLEARYGERGKRFAASDSCWLLTLIPLEVGAIRKSISWLRTVLVTRGMPTIILKSHLEVIVKEFETVFPERILEATNLKVVITELNDRQDSAVSSDRLRALILKYDQKLGEGASARFGSVTSLLASAYSDEASGINGAYDAVHSWFTDPKRFTSEWMTTIETLSVELSERAGVPA
jgi:hypothetical protein